MADKKKLSIISMSGDFDKVIAVFTLASGAAAVGYEVNIFFTFWGLNSIKKITGRSFIGSGILAPLFQFPAWRQKKSAPQPSQLRRFEPDSDDRHDAGEKCRHP